LASKIAAKDTEVSAARLGCLHEIENVEQQLVDLEVKNAERPLIPRAYTAARDVLDRRLDKAKAALAEVGAAPSPALDPRADWNALDGDDKRTMIRRFEVNIHVDAPTAPVRRWQPERVHID
jgi:hypothetical protein